MSIFRKKPNPLFEAVMAKTKALNQALLEGVKPSIDQNKFFRIIENDSKSPLIMGMGENRHLIYYPANSTPYIHEYETSIKNVEVLDGKVYDKLTGKEYVAGDKIVLYPGEKVQPYTKDLEAYVKVNVSSIDSIWENVC